MCRWMAWHGQPVLLDELLFKTPYAIADQSLKRHFASAAALAATP
jgi:hypothetical protein